MLSIYLSQFLIDILCQVKKKYHLYLNVNFLHKKCWTLLNAYSESIEMITSCPLCLLKWYVSEQTLILNNLSIPEIIPSYSLYICLFSLICKSFLLTVFVFYQTAFKECISNFVDLLFCSFAFSLINFSKQILNITLILCSSAFLLSFNRFKSIYFQSCFGNSEFKGIYL